MHNMNWELVKIFLAIARSGSATAAARQLEVNHATVLRRIEQLEQQLGVPLFQRLQSGYQLTEQGQNLLGPAQQLENSAMLLLRAAKGLQAQPEGELLVSLPDSALIDLSPSITRFCKQYPQIRLNIRTSADITDLSRLEADVAVRLTNTPPENLVGRMVHTVFFSVYASPGYLSQFAQTPKPQQCQWILWSGTTSSSIPEARHPDQLISRQLPANSVILRSNRVADVLANIKQGLGVGMLADDVAREHGLIKLPYDDMLSPNKLNKAELWLLRHKDLGHSKRVRAFIQFMAGDLPQHFAR